MKKLILSERLGDESKGKTKQGKAHRCFSLSVPSPFSHAYHHIKASSSPQQRGQQGMMVKECGERDEAWEHEWFWYRRLALLHTSVGPLAPPCRASPQLSFAFEALIDR